MDRAARHMVISWSRMFVNPSWSKLDLLAVNAILVCAEMAQLVMSLFFVQLQISRPVTVQS